jgi:hypothetical protein
MLDLLSCHTLLAYIDPGSGSLALQAILGFVAGGLALGAAGWRKILGFFSRSDESSRKR